MERRKGIPEFGGAEIERAAGVGLTARGGTAPTPPSPSREDFDAMVSRGRMWGFGEKDPLSPTKRALENAQTPVDYGRLYGYSENDIARFYATRRAGHPMAYDEYVRDLQNAGPRSTPEPQTLQIGRQVYD